MNHEWTRMHTNEDMTIGLLKVGRLNGNDSDRKLVERATGPLRSATSPPRFGGGRELFGSRVCRAKTRRQVAAENGQVGRSTQTQSNRSGLALNNAVMNGAERQLRPTIEGRAALPRSPLSTDNGPS